MGAGRVAADDGPGIDLPRTEHDALGADYRTVADNHVIRDSHSTGDHDVVANLTTARNAGRRHDQTPLPQADVVPYLHQIVDLGAPADDGVFERAAIHAAAGPDLDIILQNAGAELREPVMAIRLSQVAESGATHHGSGLEHHSVAETCPGITYGVRSDVTVVPGNYPLPQPRPRFDDRPRTDPGCGSDDRECPHEARRSDHRIRCDPGRGVDARGTLRRRREQLGDPAEGPAEVRNHDPGGGTPGHGRQRGGKQHRPRAGRAEGDEVPRRGQEAQRIRPRPVERGQALERESPVALQAPTDQFGDCLRGTRSGKLRRGQDPALILSITF